MNRYAIQHIVDSPYCFPISEKEIVLRLRTAKADVTEVKVIYQNKYLFGESQLVQKMNKTYSGELFDYYTVKLTLSDTRLAYVFLVNDGQKEYYFSEDGVTETYNFKLGYYNFFQYPYINKADIMHQIKWMNNAVFYQIFVERFDIGNKDKNTDYINSSWGDKPTPKMFAGGDLRGIINRLDYIKSLGVNAVYLTPVFKSISNHKYDISDYYQVDEQFGSNEDLKELVEKAHEQGIRIVLDAVFNHCSEDLKEFQDVVKKGRGSEYFDWFVIHGDRPDKNTCNYETFASCDYMPKFNTSNAKVQKYLIDIACFYINKYKIDGWRLDVSDEVSHDFWKKFRTAVKDINEDAVIIGENWHDASNYLRGDQYDSIMNYSFTKLCLDYIANGYKNAKEASNKLNELLMRNTDIVNSMMLNLLDSHDTYRFFTEVKEDKEKLKMALCMLFMYPGAPCIYYGTENYTTGGFDPDCRKCMDWDMAQNDCEGLKTLIRTLAKLRHDYDFSQADTKIYAIDDVLVISHRIDNSTITLYVNNSDNEYEVEEKVIQPNSHNLYIDGGRIL